MNYINYIIKNVHEDIIYKISNDKIDITKRDDFIKKYNKYNYKEIIIERGNDNIKSKKIIIQKYKKIQAALIIQKHYRNYLNRVYIKKKIY